MTERFTMDSFTINPNEIIGTPQSSSFPLVPFIIIAAVAIVIFWAAFLYEKVYRDKQYSSRPAWVIPVFGPLFFLFLGAIVIGGITGAQDTENQERATIASVFKGHDVNLTQKQLNSVFNTSHFLQSKVIKFHVGNKTVESTYGINNAFDDTSDRYYILVTSTDK